MRQKHEQRAINQIIAPVDKCATDQMDVQTNRRKIPIKEQIHRCVTYQLNQ